MVLKVQRHWTLLPRAKTKNKKMKKKTKRNEHPPQAVSENTTHTLWDDTSTTHFQATETCLQQSTKTHLIWVSGGEAPHAWQLPRPTEQSVTTMEQPGGGQPVPLATLVTVATGHWREGNGEKKKGDVRDIWWKTSLLSNFFSIMHTSSLVQN